MALFSSWIKMRSDLANDPAVVCMANRLEVDPDLVVGKLARLWSWANTHTEDGRAIGVGFSWLDAYLGAPGFCLAMAEVGWLEERVADVTMSQNVTVTECDMSQKCHNDVTKMSQNVTKKSVTSVTFPDWEKHNGSLKKARTSAAQRQAKSRAARANKLKNDSYTTHDNGSSIQNMSRVTSQKCHSDVTCDTSVTSAVTCHTREEKSREEKNSKYAHNAHAREEPANSPPMGHHDPEAAPLAEWPEEARQWWQAWLRQWSARNRGLAPDPMLCVRWKNQLQGQKGHEARILEFSCEKNTGQLQVGWYFDQQQRASSAATLPINGKAKNGRKLPHLLQWLLNRKRSEIPDPIDVQGWDNTLHKLIAEGHQEAIDLKNKLEAEGVEINPTREIKQHKNGKYEVIYA